MFGFNTTRTYTTSYGYSTTITLADAMIIRQQNMCRNLGACFASLKFAIAFQRACRAAKKGR